MLWATRNEECSLDCKNMLLMLFAKYERLEIIYIDYIFNNVNGLKQNNKNAWLNMVS
jgi:hypothetical protein